MKRHMMMCLLLVLSVVSSVAQYVVELKNGSLIRGELVEYTPQEKLTIKTRDGNVFVFTHDEIESIVNDKSVTGRTAEMVAEKDRYRVPHGYRGFLDILPFNATKQGYVFSMKTTHGYHLNHNVFVGGGMGMTVDYTFGHVLIPIYAAFKGNVGSGPVQFAYGVNAGCYYDPYAEADGSDNFVDTNTNFYGGCNVAMRFGINKHLALRLASEFDLYLGTSIKLNYGWGLGLGLEF